MFNTRSKQGIKEKWEDRYNMSKTIVKQGIEESLGYCAKELRGVISPMSKTRLNQGIEGKWGDCSNVYKTIVKQDIEGRLGYCANEPIGVSSPMSNTGSNQGIEVNGRIAPVCLRPL